MPDGVDAEARDQGLDRQLAALGERAVAGWKVGLTSGLARDSMGAGFRPFGYLLPERVFASGSTIPLDAFGRAGVENELCFRIGAALRGSVSWSDAMAAVAAVAPAFEINERRLGPDASAADRLADNLNQWGIVVGAEQPLDWRGFDFQAIRVVLRRDGVAVETVAARGHIDDHFDAIAALARQLGRFGRALHPGARVITGSYTRQSVAEAGSWEGDFGTAIGRVAVAFA